MNKMKSVHYQDNFNPMNFFVITDQLPLHPYENEHSLPHEECQALDPECHLELQSQDQDHQGLSRIHPHI